MTVEQTDGDQNVDVKGTHEPEEVKIDEDYIKVTNFKIDTLEDSSAVLQLGSATFRHGATLKAKTRRKKAIQESLGHITNEADNSKHIRNVETCKDPNFEEIKNNIEDRTSISKSRGNADDDQLAVIDLNKRLSFDSQQEMASYQCQKYAFSATWKNIRVFTRCFFIFSV